MDSLGRFASTYDPHDQGQPQRTVSDDQRGTRYINRHAPYEGPVERAVLGLDQGDARTLFRDRFVHEREHPQLTSSRGNQRSQYFPGPEEHIASPDAVWLGQNDTIAATHGPFVSQPYPSRWEDASWLYNNNGRMSGLQIPHGVAPFAGLPQAFHPRLEDKIVSHRDKDSRRWKEYVPRSGESGEPEETPVVHSPVWSEKGKTKNKSKTLEIEERDELSAAVVGAEQRASVHKTKMKMSAKAKKDKQQAPPVNSFGVYFTEVTEARQGARGLDWPPREDDTLPNTKEERVAVVRELFAAIQDTSDIQDKKSSPMLKKRWLAESAEESNEDGVGDPGKTKRKQSIAKDTVYKPWIKERLCWEILVSVAAGYAMTGANMNKETTERIYREGTAFVSILDPVMIERCEKYRELTFKERISSVVGVLKSYKSRVDKLLRGGCVEEYVLCPDAVLQISSSNREQNDERQKDLAHGRKREDRPVKKPGKKKQIRRSIIRHHGTLLTIVVAPTPATSRKRTRYNPEDASDVEEPQKSRTRRT